MTLLENEKMVASLDNDRIELSNLRLQLINGYDYKIINLNQISYIETEERKKTILLILGLAALIIGIVGANYNMGDGAGIFVAIGAISLIIYFLFPNKNLVVRSSGGTITYKVNWIKKQDVDRFIFLVQREMNKKSQQ